MPKINPFYVVVCDDGPNRYSYENDYVSLDLGDQWKIVVELVASGQWDDVFACYLVHPVNGTCEDKLTDLANAVDAYHEHRGEDPSDYIAEWIESITGDDAWRTEETRRRIARERDVDYAIDIARGK